MNILLNDVSISNNMLKEGLDDMQVEEFKNKFAEIYKKAEMECYDYPIVFDEDEDGDIYLSSDGTFYFSDKCSNWINSTLGLKDYANIRMKKDYSNEKQDELEHSYLYINFNTCAQIEFEYFPEEGVTRIYVYYPKSAEDNQQAKDFLNKCSHSYVKIIMKSC